MRIVRLPLPLLAIAWLLAGCATGWSVGGQEGEDLDDTDTTDGDTGEADTDTDADTDADTDTDTDADTDTDTDADTGEDTADTGGGTVYTGPFVIDAVDAAGVADRCAGSVVLNVVTATITGTGACTFAGPLVTAFPDGLGASVVGTIASDDTVSGTLGFTVGASDTLPWSGTLGSDLSGGFAGSLAGASTTLTVTGRLDGALE